MSANTTQENNFAQTVFADPKVFIPGIMDMLSIPEIVKIFGRGVTQRFELHLLAVMQYRQLFASGNDADLQRVAKRMVASHRQFALREEHRTAMAASLFAIDLRALRTWERMNDRTATPQELEQFLRGTGGTFDFAALHMFPVEHPVDSFTELEDHYVAILPEVVPTTSSEGLDKFWYAMPSGTIMKYLGFRANLELIGFIEGKSNHHLRRDFIAAASQDY